uniref:Ig-like domain-containing protein n=1 Tax=Varanus komodoensis TaxID=61221 RepID=A0A8D2IGH6_VARKO
MHQCTHPSRAGERVLLSRTRHFPCLFLICSRFTQACHVLTPCTFATFMAAVTSFHCPFDYCIRGQASVFLTKLPTVDGGTPFLDLWGSRKSKLLKLSLWARCPLGGFLGAQERPAPCQALERFCIHPRGALSAEPPEVTVTRRAGQDDTETLTCRAYGFYPQEIDMVWTRDGEVRQQDASREVLAPNSDGTFYAWLSVKINPWDRVRFLCRVEHDALQTPVELAWEEPASILDHLIWPTTGVLVLLPGIVLAVLSLSK